MAGWPQQDHDKRDRAKIAHELDRREFWKECYKLGAMRIVGEDVADAQSLCCEFADASLRLFEEKFPPLHGAS